ncbi:amidase family protein [Novosphingobium sp. MBES04]|uniref:amidase family protein n=1 Tax=Novosphingobium sp. MBES04 TaxID=1206458 RepID=UPI00072320F2|nr:amidase family protein [Novosphingobium sp. MBES04]GAM04220.1 amidase [Novosphingobium sp. MBES04]
MSRAGEDTAWRLAAARGLNAIAAHDAREGALSQESAPVVLVKDNIAVRGQSWTAGSPLFAGCRADRDAGAVQRLREAGACFPVRTTLHELAFGVTGANAWSGDIANPHDPGRIAGGSSGGAGAALALGLGDLALVTDTGGSARIPAALCGVIGFRPSTGRYPGDGLIGLSPSRDTLGLMARSLAPILWADAVIAAEAKEEPGFPGSPTIAIPAPEALGSLEPAVGAAFARNVAVLEALGVRTVPCDLSRITALDEACGFPIALFETARSLAASVPALTGRDLASSLGRIAGADVRELVASALSGEAVPQAVYDEAIGTTWPALRGAFAELFADGIDAVLQPTVPMVAPARGGGETVTLCGEVVPAFPTLSRFTRPDSMAGLPAISLPVGCDDAGLPVGMMLTGARGRDRALLQLAARLAGPFRDKATRAVPRRG